MNKTIKEILKEADSIMAQHAAFDKVAAPATEGADSMPGSNRDKPVPAGYGSSNPEVKEGLPPGSTENHGEEAEKLESGHAKDVTQKSNAKVDKEPLTTADADAQPKTGAAAMANDLLSKITQYTKQAGNPKGGSTPKEAAGLERNLELSNDLLAKIARFMLNTEEGYKLAEAVLVKEAGAEAARETIATLQKQAEYEQGAADAAALVQAQAQAEYEDGAKLAEALIGEQVQQAEIQKQAAYQQQLAMQGPAAQQAVMQKQAADEYARGQRDAETMVGVLMEKQAQAQRQQQVLNAVNARAAQLNQQRVNPLQAVKLGQAVADAALGGEVPGAEDAMAAMAGGAGQEAGGGGDPEMEQLIAMISQLSPEELQQLQEYLAGAGQVEEGAEQMEAGAPGEEAAAADLANGGMEVAASAGALNNKLAAILGRL